MDLQVRQLSFTYKKRSVPAGANLFNFWRYHPDLNRGIEVLQTSALPLGYGTVLCKMAGGPLAPGQAVERNTRFELATFTLAR